MQDWERSNLSTHFCKVVWTWRIFREIWEVLKKTSVLLLPSETDSWQKQINSGTKWHHQLIENGALMIFSYRINEWKKDVHSKKRSVCLPTVYILNNSVYAVKIKMEFMSFFLSAGCNKGVGHHSTEATRLEPDKCCLVHPDVITVC